MSRSRSGSIFSKLSLARLPTPIQKLERTSSEIGKEIFVWRDDLNGMIESGNKLRKLEFLMADALQQGCDTIITCGGPQSNHTRATSVVARKLGLDVTLLILPRPGFDLTQTPQSNWLINQIFGAQLKWLNYDDFQKTGLGYEPFLDEEAARIKKNGKKPYVIPLGGSNLIGVQGYREAVREMLCTWENLTGTRAPDDLFCTLGSGGTLVGLEWGMMEHTPMTRLHGVNVIGPIETANRYVNQLHDSIRTTFNIDLSQCNTSRIDGYVGLGYSLATQDDLNFYSNFAQKEGILLDPCYTGKAFQGMLSEIRQAPENFGDKILFLHSGGALGIFAYAGQFESHFPMVSASKSGPST
jgi:D-cysteine desulfhydrase